MKLLRFRDYEKYNAQDADFYGEFRGLTAVSACRSVDCDDGRREIIIEGEKLN